MKQKQYGRSVELQQTDANFLLRGEVIRYLRIGKHWTIYNDKMEENALQINNIYSCTSNYLPRSSAYTEGSLRKPLQPPKGTERMRRTQVSPGSTFCF